MIKKINDILAGIPMTILAGIALVVSLMLTRLGIEVALDPAWAAVVISGLPLLYLAIWRIFYNPGISKISSALLISIAMFAAIAIGDLFAAGEVAFIMSIGAILEDKTTERAKKGLKQLIGLAPTKGRLMRREDKGKGCENVLASAREIDISQEQSMSQLKSADIDMLDNNTGTMIDAQDIRVGDILRVLPGEIIPVDGEIILGDTSVDQSILTGESLPVDKTVGDMVFCGTCNRFGAIDLRATKVGEDSSLQKLIRMVEEAEKNKAPMQRMADQWASYLVPVALLLAILAYGVTGDITRGVTILVVFCPCALVLATPTAIMAAIGQATKHGVIIKSGEALEHMGKVDTITFDKTGTLTEGSLRVCDIVVCQDAEEKMVVFAIEDRSDMTQDAAVSMDEVGQDVQGASTLTAGTLAEPQRKLLALTASAEALSEHPLGKAIVAAAKNQKLPLSPATDFVMEAGKGIAATLEGQRLFCGSETYLKGKGVQIAEEQEKQLRALQEEGKATVMVAAMDKRETTTLQPKQEAHKHTLCDIPTDNHAVEGESYNLLGIIALSDTIRDTATSVINRLDAMGVHTVLLTGDNPESAAYLARQVGLNELYASLLPEDKVAKIQELQAAGGYICMVGDGVNDAPALKLANVGVAMGSMGSDIAIEAADIALMSDDITRLPYLKRLSDATVATIRRSIGLSLCINALAIVLSLLGVLTPTTGALVHNAGSCFVVLFAALLYDRKFV